MDNNSFDYDIFLCHSSADKPRVRRLAECLRDAGLKVWFDEWEILPGDDIYLKIEHGIECSQALALVMSTHAFGSEWVSLERGTSIFRNPTNTHRRFIPILLEDCRIPEVIRRFRYLDLTSCTDEALDCAVQQCCETIHGKNGSKRSGSLGNRQAPPRADTRDLAEIAHLDGSGNVVFTIASPKATSANDAAVRLELVAIRVWSLLKNEEWVSSPKVIVPLLKYHRCYDGNTRRAIAAHKGILRQGQQRSLDQPAQQEADSIIEELKDPGFVGSWNPGGNPARRRR